MVSAIWTFGRALVQTKWFQLLSLSTTDFSSFYSTKPYMIEKRDFIIGASISSFIYLTHLILDDESWLQKFLKKLLHQWVLVGEVQTLTIYPMKSGRGSDFPVALATKTGLKNGLHEDRVFVILDKNSGNFVSARPRVRDNPKLVLIEIEIEDGFLTLSAKGFSKTVEIDLNKIVKAREIEQVKIWTDLRIDGYDCGNSVGDWLTEFLGAPPGKYRLLYHRQTLFNERLIRNDDNFHVLIDSKRDDKAIFADLAPYLLTTEASLDDLNTKLVEPVSMKHFRPNIVVSGTCSAFDEDNWADIKIGDSEFTNFKPCGRCLLTTVNPETAEINKDTQPLATLRKYRTPPAEERPLFGSAPYFGINLILNNSVSNTKQQIRVGDKVYAKYK